MTFLSSSTNKELMHRREYLEGQASIARNIARYQYEMVDRFLVQVRAINTILGDRPKPTPMGSELKSEVTLGAADFAYEVPPVGPLTNLP